MKRNSIITSCKKIIVLFIILLITANLKAQTGTYSQSAPSIYSVNSYTPVTFTNAPLSASNGTLSFQWIACHQSGFGSSTVNVDINVSGNYQTLATYSSSLDCSTISQNVFISGSVLSAAAQSGGGTITVRFYIQDGCQAGVGCASVNDPAVVAINLSYAYSIADFTSNLTSICPGNTVTFTDITPGTVLSRNWSFPDGSPSSATGASPTITYTTPGNYNVTLTTTTAAGTDITTKTNYITVLNPPTSTITAGGPVTFCSGGNVVLTSTTGTGYTYKWKKGGNNISGANSSAYSATGTGNYKVLVTDNNGCTVNSNSIYVTVNANPVAIINANGPVNFCPGNTVTLQAISGGGFSYQWKKNGNSINGATAMSYVANATGNYFCKITNGNGCTSSSNVIGITVNTPKATVTVSGNTTFCQGGSVLLKANTGAGQTYQWIRNGANITGETDSVYTATISGNYKVMVTNSCGSSTATAKIITVNNLPGASITASGPLTFCSGSTVTLNANTGTGLTYVWKKNGTPLSGAVNASYVASTSGSYTVKVTNSSGCSSSSNTVTVTVNATIASISAGGPTTFCNGDSVVITANSGTGLTYQWLKNNININGATSNKYTAKTAGTYKVIVTNSISGCAAISSGIAVTVNCRTAASLPDFKASCSPNPFSAEFELDLENYSGDKISIEIFSVTGKLVFAKEIISPKTIISTGNQLSPGIYILRIKQGETIENIKLVKSQ